MVEQESVFGRPQPKSLRKHIWAHEIFITIEEKGTESLKLSRGIYSCSSVEHAHDNPHCRFSYKPMGSIYWRSEELRKEAKEDGYEEIEREDCFWAARKGLSVATCMQEYFPCKRYYEAENEGNKKAYFHEKGTPRSCL